MNISNQFREMLDILHAGGAYGYWWYRNSSTNGKVSRWWNVGDPLGINEGMQDVYYGIHPVADIPTTNRRGEPVAPEAARSQIAHISAINCLFGEYDAKDYGTKDAALRHISAITPRPSVLVDSGGGYHAYWLLDATKELHSAEDRAFMAAMQARWVKFVGSDTASKDLARVLRVPGTHNHKYNPAPEVAFIWRELDTQYNLDELIALLPEEAPKTLPAREVKPTTTPTDRLGAFIERALRDEVAEVVACADGLKHDTLRNAAVKIGTLIPHGLDSDRAFNMLHNAILGRAADMRNADETIEDGLRYGAQSPRDISHIAEREPVFKDGVACCPTHGTALVRSSNGNGWRCDKDLKCFWWKGEGYTPMQHASYSEGAISEEPVSTYKPWFDEDELHLIKPPTFLVDGVVVYGETTMIIGPSDAGKTFIVMDMVMRVSMRYPIMYVAGEDRSGVNIRRLAWYRHYGRTSNRNFRIWKEDISLFDEQQVRAFITYNQGLGTKMIVFDTLSQCSNGADENSAKDMATVMTNANRVAHECNAAVIIIHHTTKAESSYRGSGAIKGNTYGFLNVTKEDDVIKFDCERIKNTRPFDPRYYKLVVDIDTGLRDQDGKPITSCVIRPSRQIIRSAKLSKTQYRVLEIIGVIGKAEGKVSSTAAMQSLDLKGNSFYKPLNVLLDRGYVQKADGRGGGYQITQEGRDYLRNEYNSVMDGSEDDMVSEIFTVANVEVNKVESELTKKLTTVDMVNSGGDGVDTANNGVNYGLTSGFSDEVDNELTADLFDSAYVEPLGYSDATIGTFDRGDSEVNNEVNYGLNTVNTHVNSTSLSLLGREVDEERVSEKETKVDYGYLGGCYARGDMKAIEVHCAMRKLDKAVIIARLEEMMAVPDEDDGF